MTEAALADAANEAIEALCGTPGSFSDRQVRRWLSGDVTKPWPKTVLAVAHALQTDPDRLGWRLDGRVIRVPAGAASSSPPPTTPQENPPVLRREFLSAATASLFDAALPPAGRIGITDVDRVRSRLESLHEIDDLSGGTQLAYVAEELARRVETAMRNCVFGPRVERALYVVLGEIYASAGWYAFDSSDNSTAAAHYDAALRAGMLAGDRTLQARVWACMSRLAWELRRSAETITIARVALDATRNGRDPRLGALLHCRLAIGYAQGGQAARSGQALARAETLLGQAEPDGPAWLSFCNEAEVLGAGAMAYMTLGRPVRAVELEEYGSTAVIGRYRRNHYAKLVHLALCQLGAGRVEEAAGSASQAVGLREHVTCPRWDARLCDFRKAVDAYTVPEARQFVARYDAVVAA
ncbi:hypothetical protein LO772_08205 [Yinghuangia sp. ASG 101]|uniref:hypothetical protein n=1 Tax=Yinghuangia sp. ASG 101 TaxID=2896848 RepID=UPI001E56A74C|nr:hypothetical protein [Yinghuangia sp. ASG 101]UGQ13575.1 hypothetical protein LO772_08205 [Yinghuangia sp. ASG 101]